MKSIYYVSCLLTTLFLLVIVSCTQDNEVYSCNQEINNWVKENKTYIQTLTRSQWCELRPSVSRPAYIAFTPSQKVRFWKEKIEEVKSLDWSKEELLHIQEVENFIVTNTQYFRNGRLSEKEYDEIETFFVKWIKTGERKYNWTTQTAMAVVCTGYKMLDKRGNIFIPQNNKEIMSAPIMLMTKETTCNCNKGSLFTCVNDPFGGCEDSKPGCEETDKGCGFAFLFSCNGTCGGI